jgi:hypothetical protein
MLCPTYDFMAFLKALENKTWAEIKVAVENEIRSAENALRCASQKKGHLYEERGWDLFTYCQLLKALAEHMYNYNPREPAPDLYKPVFQTTSGLPERVRRMVNQFLINKTQRTRLMTRLFLQKFSAKAKDRIE